LDGSTSLARRAYEIALFGQEYQKRDVIEDRIVKDNIENLNNIGEKKEKKINEVLESLSNVNADFTDDFYIPASYPNSLPPLPLDMSIQKILQYYPTPSSIPWIYLISTRAGGLGIYLFFIINHLNIHIFFLIGLNLQAADTVILYDTDYNPTIDKQAQDRCYVIIPLFKFFRAHRIGQTHPVHVYRLICRNTCEERILSIAERKSILGAFVLRDDGKEEGIERYGNDFFFFIVMAFLI
jgi:hypothetical protein